VKHKNFSEMNKHTTIPNQKDKKTIRNINALSFDQFHSSQQSELAGI